MKCLGRILLFIIAAVLILFLLWWFFLRNGPDITADLAAYHSDVEQWDASASKKVYVAQGQHQDMYEQDGVTVNDNGRARLDMSGCILEIYRNTGLQVQQLPSQSAQVCVLQLGHGTLLNNVNKKTIINTEFAVITSLSTEFFVHYDPRRGLLWVIVKDGAVSVEANNRSVIVDAGWQTWVYEGRPPENPVSASRAEVGDLFPPLEELVNGEYKDDYLLEDVEEPLETEERVTLAPIKLSVEVSADKIYAGECGEPQILELHANLSGSPEAIADVGWAILRYQWEGIEEQEREMERVDDSLFFSIIDPYEYCCYHTTIVYTIDVFSHSGELLSSRSGKVPLEYCIG